MPGLWIGGLLLLSLLLVLHSRLVRPRPANFPLDVDEGLPLPEIGQASTVFSLSAMFGAYLGIYLFLGMPALSGVAIGTIIGFYLLKTWIIKSKGETFEAFLEWVLRGPPNSIEVLAISIFIAQCLYATSELLIFREVAKLVFPLASGPATILAVLAGTIGYFYVLFGGWPAVFRTDVLQFLIVAGMGIALSRTAFTHGMSAQWSPILRPRPGYWEIPGLGHGWVLYICHFILGVIIGAGFLTINPDAWKRVFIVTKKTPKKHFRFIMLVFVGILPFCILPLLTPSISHLTDGPIHVDPLFGRLVADNTVFIWVSLGLVASFMSAFNSALIAAVHTVLIMRRRIKITENEYRRFHWLMIIAFVFICFSFRVLVSTGNPYLPANLLMGVFGPICGAQLATGGAGSLVPSNRLFLIYVIGFVGWFFYVVSTLGLPTTPSTYQVNTIFGAAIYVIMCTLMSYLALKKEDKCILNPQK